MADVARAKSVVKPGDWQPDQAAACVTLTFDERFRRRFRMADDSGGEFLLDLTEARRLEDGDGLVLDDGRILLVQAALEDVLDIACISREDALRIAWHLGNRHTPVQILGNGSLRIGYDHVLQQLAELSGAKTARRQAPFFPEGGAYEPHAH
jgi:urease accessory protein